jgi:hypothetical protein
MCGGRRWQRTVSMRKSSRHSQACFGLARHVNASIAHICQTEPRHFPQRVQDAGLAGVEIASNIKGMSPGDDLSRQQFFWGGAWNEATPTRETQGPAPADVAGRFWYDSLVVDRRALRYLIDSPASSENAREMS